MTCMVGAVLDKQVIQAACDALAEGPQFGSWISADDVNHNVRTLDVALNGASGAAKQASLCDITAQVSQVVCARGGVPLLANQAGGDWLPIETLPEDTTAIIAGANLGDSSNGWHQVIGSKYQGRVLSSGKDDPNRDIAHELIYARYWKPMHADPTK